MADDIQNNSTDAIRHRTCASVLYSLCYILCMSRAPLNTYLRGFRLVLNDQMKLTIRFWFRVWNELLQVANQGRGSAALSLIDSSTFKQESKSQEQSSARC